MQWSGGANGGFSTADSQQLFLPAIIDPVYGFGAVNVDSQARNSSSLLNWMKRLIAMRKAHRTFGRGTLRFLRPGNRKILAYLREHEDETILCVANLSRGAQPVELDLSQFKGRVPVELMGRTAFPPVGELPYLLTLSAHGFYAFRLAGDVAAPAWHEERQVSPDLPVLVLMESGWGTLLNRGDGSGGMKDLMARRAREQLEGQIMPRFFYSQPWFLMRNLPVRKFELGEMHEWSTEQGSWLLVIVVLTLANGEAYRFAVPLARVWEDEDEAIVSTLLHATLAKVRHHARTGVLFDAFWDDDFCLAIVSSMHDGSALVFDDGQVSFHATSAFPGPVVSGASATVTRTVSERGRLFVNMGDRLILKGYRWLLPGVHPELEMSRFLTETAKFTHMAQLAGTVEYMDDEGRNSTLAILEHYAGNQGSGWAYTQDYLQRYLDEFRTQQKRPIDARHAAYMTLINTLGLRTAEFHQALAQPDANGAFGVEPITIEDLAEWVDIVRAQMDEMYKLLEAKWPNLLDPAQAIGKDLLSARPKFYRRITRVAAIHPEALKARCHGDYSLRQVWLSNNDFLITNYGSGPERAWRERRWKHSPLRDVAGMLFSFSEVAAAALEHVTDEYPESTAMLAQQADKWQTLASADFFKSYRRAMKGNSLFPADTGVTDALVTLFMVEKAVASVSNALVQQSKSADGTMQRLMRLMQRRR